MSLRFPTFDEWFAGLSTADRKRTRKLVAQFKKLGAKDPKSWARSEVAENIAQLARFVVLNRICSDSLEKWLHAGTLNKLALYDEEFGNLLSKFRIAGVTDSAIAKFAEKVATIIAFDIVHTIDEGHDPNSPTGLPTWYLAEGDAEGNPTGRGVGALHESIGEFFPKRQA
jgi:hypothetical protein